MAFTVFRVLFYCFNIGLLSDYELINFIGGIRYDLFAVSYLLAPFILIYSFSFGQLKKTSKFFFLFPIVVATAFECIDFQYFKFTNKRTSFDLFTTEGMGNDIWNLIPAFVNDFWYNILLFILLIVCIGYLYNKSPHPSSGSIKVWHRLVVIPVVLTLSVIASRGGLQLRPISFTDAGKYATTNNIPLVLNTTYSILKSSYKEDLAEKYWLEEDEQEKLFDPIKWFEGKDSNELSNVVIIILESFGQEYIGTYHHRSNFTPFLDSLSQHSLYFPNAYANGKKSIEALPAILSSLPNLMKSPYISSKYGSNKINSIAKTLKKYGYNSSFYHGATTGTMGFSGFSSTAGIGEYFGLEDYPDQEDFDGKWGIFDEPYFNYFRNELNQKDEPFLSVIFSLSSHHPYTIPEKHIGRFPKGDLPILESVAYTDYALSQFFAKAQDEPWFDQTIFVITADHTSTSQHKKYSSRTGIYKIPLMFYAPGIITPKKSSKTVSQVDIYPTLIDVLGINDTIYAFGESVFTPGEGYAINFLNDQYQIIQNNQALLFDGKDQYTLKTKNNGLFTEADSVEYQKNAKTIETQLKAIIQRYNHDLINNKTFHE